jgi:protein phosphatase PTC1
MEDLHVVDTNLSLPPTLAHLKQGGNTGFFAIYDGHGGTDAVQLVASSLHVHLQRALLSLPTPEEALATAFALTDAEMKEGECYRECGTTAVCALVLPSPTGRRLHLAHTGDSRCVVAEVQEGTMVGRALTMDHKPDRPSEMQRVYKEGGWVLMGRLDGCLAVSRALGDMYFKERGLSAVPEQRNLELNSSHHFLILACDGLWDVVSDDEAVQAVKHMTASQAMAKVLVKMALQRGSTDNVTVMVLRLLE